MCKFYVLKILRQSGLFLCYFSVSSLCLYRVFLFFSFLSLSDRFPFGYRPLAKCKNEKEEKSEREKERKNK